MSRRYWILATETATQGIFPSVWDFDSDYPMLFDDLDEAEAKAWEFLVQYNTDLRDDRYYALSQIGDEVQGADRIAEIRQIIDDYQYQQEPFDFPLEVEVHDDGSMSVEMIDIELSKARGRETYTAWSWTPEELSRLCPTTNR